MKIQKNWIKLVLIFYQTTACLLYASKRARPDLQTSVVFLCKRVKSSTKDNYKKLTRVIRYVRESIALPLIIGWNNSGSLVWSIDASFAVHMDMKSHTGYSSTMGKGALI